MNLATPSFFVTGGTLPLEAGSYLERAADQDLLTALQAGEYCFVLNARQMGKSSLSVRAVVQLAQQGIRTVFVDLQKFGGANVNPEQWYLGLLLEMGRGLDLREEFLAYWQEQVALSPVQRLFGALREVALEQLEKPLVVFVDEIDMVRSLSFPVDEFFGAMREFYNQRVLDPIYGRIAFCLVGSAFPSDLTQDRRTSPFNVGQRIELQDFTEEEVLPLAEGLDRPNAEALLKRVYYWTNGHPYLTQSLCAEVAKEDAVHTPGELDQIVERLFFAPQARERNVNLADVTIRLLESPAGGQTPEDHRAAVLKVYGQILGGVPVVDDEAERPVAVLKLSGTTRTVDGELQVRNRIYERVFDTEWVEENLPDPEVQRLRRTVREEERRRREAEEREQQIRHLLYISDLNRVQNA